MTSCTNLSRGKQSSGCLWLSLLYLFLVTHSEARPVPTRTTARERWKNPCEINLAEIVVRKFLGLNTQSKEEMCRNVIQSAKVAHKQAKSVLENFVEQSFKDKSFIEGTASHRLNWLPKVNLAEVTSMLFKEAICYFYNVLQYFAVGLEQIISDQVVYDGKYLSDFRDVEDNMAQLLCTIQATLSRLGAKPNEDVTRDVMRQQYRNIGSHSQRLIRNYLILRDYVEMLDVMVQTLEVIYARTFPTTPDLTSSDSWINSTT